MEINTHKRANNAGLVNNLSRAICLPLNLINKVHNACTFSSLAAAISQTTTQAILTTSKRLAINRPVS
ncbi:hypothetical protein [Methylobacter sp. S3L5C]|uniref:hypothetical protein n=1 Tax=Methylobacter sp. S3L5C TaxID=2839024 RepID=UPI001FAC93E9|nr:hypothetical protein [Methylobacter sp. S3L5C]UOA07383.1 hypothetical protein KKZ03_13995 [Methylobacter sp. S3L5C]